MAEILALAGVNGAGKSSLLGSGILRAAGLDWFNPDDYTRLLVQQGRSLAEANELAWHEGKNRLSRAIADSTGFAFETTLGGNTIPALLAKACETQEVTIWYCGLSNVELHIQRVAERHASGGHNIPEAKIRERYDTSRKNLLNLMAGLNQLHVYDNSAPIVDCQADLMPILEMGRDGIHFPTTVEDLAKTPDWAKPIVARALELYPTPGLAP